MSPIIKDQSLLENILIECARRAQAGTLDNADRVSLYRLAMTVASEEFYRIESINRGCVSTEALLLLQQITALCADDVNLYKLFGSAGVLDYAPQNTDAGGSLASPEGIREA